MKNLLLITIALLGMSMGINAQTIILGSNSTSSYFLCSSGFAEAWGNNYYGQLGDGTTMDRHTPDQVSALSDITAIAGGLGFSLFVKNDGSVWACGQNNYGQLGDGTTSARYTPVSVSELSGAATVAAGEQHSLFLKNDGSVWACGRNNYGQLGDGTNTSSNTPVQVSGLSGITAIAAGQLHSLFLKNDGTVWACGKNNSGQLGDGTSTTSNTPVQVSGLSGITAVAAGKEHSLFLKNDGSVWACGKNEYGQLGDGTTNTGITPMQVSGPSGITAIAAGLNHSFFLENDGSVWACGSNYAGELGNGTTTNLPNATPFQMSGLSGITAVAAGSHHSLFLKNNGDALACGFNSSGQLGDGTTTDKNSPVQVLIDTQCGNVGIEKVNSHFSELTVYPNPAYNSIFIKMVPDNQSAKQYTLKVYNIVGQEVLQSTDNYWDNHQSTIDVSSLSPGVYFICLFDEKNQHQGKFVKE